jgi:putative hydrolase of the HAD superfamily
MKFYRRLTQVHAISFDLDDTLYSNRPIMLQAEQAMQQFFVQHLPQTATLSRQFWLTHRKAAIQAQPQLKHDVTALRIASYTLAITELTNDKLFASALAHQAVDEFMLHRSNFTVPEASLNLLAKLAAKFPLIAITNGNVDTKKIGLAPYFTNIYHPALGFKSKPDSAMFKHACENLHIANDQLLHVGDCGHADIAGALLSGCQAAWLNKYKVGKTLSILPHIELHQLNELEELL